jgi:hypothetical protein
MDLEVAMQFEILQYISPKYISKSPSWPNRLAGCAFPSSINNQDIYEKYQFSQYAHSAHYSGQWNAPLQ